MTLVRGIALLALVLLLPLAQAQVVVPAPPSVDSKSFILMDHFSGAVLAELNPDARMDPASLTKMMTSYVVFDELKKGHIKLEDEVTVSEKAWRMPGSRTAKGLREAAQIWIGPSPTLSNQPPPQELEQMLHVAKKFDVAGRDEHNRALGRAGEERVVAHERSALKVAGRGDLARKVRWISEEDGDGA